MVDAYKKINKFDSVISYFLNKEWIFKNDNTQALWRKMSPTDRDLFNFNISTLDWDAYYFTYVRGIRVYLLKDPLDTIPQGLTKRRKLMMAHYSLVCFICILVFVFLRIMLRFMF